MSSRWTIAGLMLGVLFVAVGMAALRYYWLASAMFLATCGVMALAAVGVVCGAESARAWWLGFAAFGWGYMAWSIWTPFGVPITTQTLTLEAIKAGEFCLGVRAPRLPDTFWIVCRCLWSLGLATLGGVLARVLFPPPAAPASPDPDRPVAVRSSRRSAAWPLLALVLLAAVVVASSRTAPGLWAGVTVFVTWGLLGLAAVGAVFDRGVRRARWLGAALFGMGFLALVWGRHDELSWPQYATGRLLNTLRPWLPTIPTEHPAPDDAVAAGNLRILKVLDRVVPMRFPEDTPLGDVLKHVRAATRGPDGRDVPIYVDPVGLMVAEKTLDSPVSLALDGVPLRSTLRVALAQLGMTYEVRDGLLVITAEPDEDRPYPEPIRDDPFLLAGHHLLALFAGAVGFATAPVVLGAARGARPGRRS